MECEPPDDGEEDDDEDEDVGEGEGAEQKPKTNKDEGYLKDLRDCEQHQIDKYDNTILKLTAGAIGISVVFLKSLISAHVLLLKFCLVTAWVSWLLGLALSLAAFYCSHVSMRVAQRRYHDGEREEANLAHWTGSAAKWGTLLAGITFIFGLIFMVIFVTNNLSNESTKGSSPTNFNNPQTLVINGNVYSNFWIVIASPGSSSLPTTSTATTAVVPSPTSTAPGTATPAPPAAHSRTP
jgi:hypothetical protein